jgi:hypothetical protein
VKGHAGLETVAFTHVTRSVLVTFDPRQVRREEVVMRIALALSLSMGDVPVAILKSPQSEILTNGAAFAGILTGTALVVKWLSRGAQAARTVEQVAAGGTGVAVLQHGWREVRERGYFDPEVLSLTYLITSSLRGDYARGALITWMLSFGRHLMSGAGEGVEIRPMQREARDGGPPRYEVVVVEGVSRQAPLFRFLQSVVRYFAAAGAPGGRGLIDEMRAVSRAHGEMVEGLGWMRQDIPIIFDRR